jgi:hypothetical protein
VVTDRYKLVHFFRPEIDRWELFDRATDPQELQDVHGRPDYASIQHELETELLRLRQELKVVEDSPADLPSAMENRRQEAAKAGPPKPDGAKPE